MGNPAPAPPVVSTTESTTTLKSSVSTNGTYKTNGSTTMTSNGTYFSNGDGSPDMSPTMQTFNDSIRVPKVSVLRESMVRTSSMIRTQLGSSSSIVFDSSPTVEDFLEALANERLRHMPHDGSNWDKVLRWAENIGGHVLIFHEAVHDFMLNSEDATRLIWGSCLSLLQVSSPAVMLCSRMEIDKF
jgi:hypothetical protein